MTPEQIVLVERSLAAAAPHLDDVVRDFYRRLFVADPALRVMFGTDPGLQRERFTRELAAIMTAIRDHETFLGRARGLGERHAAYGVRTAHYRAAGTALQGALGAALGDRGTQEVAQAWRLAYSLTSEVMLSASARSPRPVTPSLP